MVAAMLAMASAFPDGYKQEQLGRVKIQVYRGPTKNYHAPWGYYFTQPEDYKKKGYHWRWVRACDFNFACSGSFSDHRLKKKIK